MRIRGSANNTIDQTPIRQIESDDDVDSSPVHTSSVQMHTQRVRNECSIPSRRRAMCCCGLFWLMVALMLATFFVIVLHTGNNNNDTQEVESIYARNELHQKCYKLGPSRCNIVHAPGIHKKGSECPPGHTWNIIDAGNLWNSKRGSCVRRHFYPRVYDASLSNRDVPICTDAYTHACGAWDEWFVEQDTDPHMILSLDPMHHHANILPVIEMSLQDQESMLYKFVHKHCHPVVAVVPTVSRDTAANWLQLQSQSQLPVWIASLNTHSICIISMINSLIPSWFYEVSLGYSSARAHSLATKMTQISSQFSECKNTTAWFGALGDLLIVQVEWTSPSPIGHNKLHELLGKNYGNAWTVANALAPFTSLIVGSGRKVQVRVALPTDKKEWMKQSHCERIASVVYTEALEDRYNALTKQQQPEIILANIKLCLQLDPPISVVLTERLASTRTEVWKCIEQYGSSDWHSLAAIVATCNSGHRIQPDQELSDAFVPQVRVDTRDSSTIQVSITAGLLQVPWFSSEMEMQSIAARLYWILLRSVATHIIIGEETCHTETLRDAWALSSMDLCFRSSMDSQFWLELLQLQCGQVCTERWAEIIQTNEMFRLAHKCGSNQIKSV